MNVTTQQTETTVFVALLAVMVVLGFWASRWRRPTSAHSLEEWGLGGRAFGNWVTWFLIGGATYTAYTFIGLPALVYGYGAAGFYAIPFAICVMPLVFLVAPRMWSVSHVHGFVTSAEFTRARFGSRTLGVLVAITLIVATLPYVAVQLVALRAVFTVAGFTGEYPLLLAIALISVSTFRSGLRAPALLSIAKDVLLTWLLLSAVMVVAMSGGWASTFQTATAHFSTAGIPGGGLLLSRGGQVSYITLAVGSALSIFAYPHAALGLIAAKDRATVRRNAAALPVYTFALGIMALLGLFALARGVLPYGSDPAAGKLGDINTITPMIFHTLFPAWCAGIAYATLAVAALIPASIMSIAAANLFTRSIYLELRPNASAREETRVSRWASLAVKFGAAAVILLITPQFSVQFQLIGGIVVLQALPAVFFGILTGWFHRFALIIGLVAGLAASVVLLYQLPEYSPDLHTVLLAHFGGSSYPLAKFGLRTDITVYVGLLTMVVNLVVVVVLTALFRLVRIPAGVDQTSPDDYVADIDEKGLGRLDQVIDGSVPVGVHAR
jgi:SSS family solute:Na+ symporter